MELFDMRLILNHKSSSMKVLDMPGANCVDASISAFKIVLRNRNLNVDEHIDMTQGYPVFKLPKTDGENVFKFLEEFSKELHKFK